MTRWQRFTIRWSRRAFWRYADRQRLVTILEEAKRMHVYTFAVPDDDGNVDRASHVEGLLDEALRLARR